MSNNNLFKSKSKSHKVLAKNNAGGAAYLLKDKEALAQFAMTGCFNGTFYSTEEEQLKQTLELANKVEPEFLAKLAIYSHEKGFMKDMPALLMAVLSNKDTKLLSTVFPRIINPKLLRNFVQIIRSGVTGRKSLGSCPRRLIKTYLASLTPEQLFRANVGASPSLTDIIKLAHPKGANKAQAAMLSYIVGKLGPDKQYNLSDLPEFVYDFEMFKKDMSNKIPDVPFQMLTALPLTKEHWVEIAKNATWTQTRMNINTFQRHGVFEDTNLVNLIAERLSNADEVKKSKVFPYQLFTTFLNVSEAPSKIRNALQNAAQLALKNVPKFSGKTYVMVDTSGSMSSPATGNRGSVTSKTRCIDVAGLFASAILNKNDDAEVIPFDTQVHRSNLNAHDSIMTNARALAAFGGGGTNCSSALKSINDKNQTGDLVIYISDNESWVDVNGGRTTQTMVEWKKFKTRNPNAKLVCIDIVPNRTSQAIGNDVLNIGGFSDNIFSVIESFANNTSSSFINEIDKVEFWNQSEDNSELDAAQKRFDKFKSDVRDRAKEISKIGKIGNYCSTITPIADQSANCVTADQVRVLINSPEVLKTSANNLHDTLLKIVQNFSGSDEEKVALLKKVNEAFDKS